MNVASHGLLFPVFGVFGCSLFIRNVPHAILTQFSRHSHLSRDSHRQPASDTPLRRFAQWERLICTLEIQWVKPLSGSCPARMGMSLVVREFALTIRDPVTVRWVRSSRRPPAAPYAERCANCLVVCQDLFLG
ncbi:hypothetical protein RISK_000876 [Rhodopirellula islandica]|uniref:Uncharacterized protein n=1 Tax=Rhodopirellula islandica TaxID=595434 RepID=A0A0J1BKL4_RHOIS|nr:hypothetical protein RISK_000876 [Rhodopirellula islandica]